MGQIIYFLGDIFPVFLRRFSPFCVVFGRFASFLGPNDGILLPGYRLFSRYGVYIDKNRIKKEMRHKTVGSKFVHAERENVTKYFFLFQAPSTEAGRTAPPPARSCSRTGPASMATTILEIR